VSRGRVEGGGADEAARRVDGDAGKTNQTATGLVRGCSSRDASVWCAYRCEEVVSKEAVPTKRPEGWKATRENLGRGRCLVGGSG